MRVLHVIPGLAPRTGGPSLNLLASARALAGVGVESTIAATDQADAAGARSRRRLSRADLPAELDIRLYAAKPPRRLAASPALDRALADLVDACDVVHIHSLFLLPQYYGFRHARRAGKPYIVSPCGALDPYLRERNRVAKRVVDIAWQRRMLEEAALLQYKTEEERDLVEDLGLHTATAVVPNGLDVSAYRQLPDPAIFRSRFGLPDGPIVLTVGRLSFKKGLDVLIDGFALVRRVCPAASLVIAGPDDEGLKPTLIKRATDHGVGDAVFFPGMLDLDDKREALAAAAVWALPSRTENFGNAVIEALAAGVPAVISRSVNLAPALAAVEAARVVDSAPEPVADAIVSLLGDSHASSTLASRGRAFAARYDWARVSPQLAEMYREVLR